MQAENGLVPPVWLLICAYFFKPHHMQLGQVESFPQIGLLQISRCKYTFPLLCSIEAIVGFSPVFFPLTEPILH
jgi:hypothetical protein